MMNGFYRKAKRALSFVFALFMLVGLFGGVASADTAEPHETRGASDYYLVGSMNGWNVNETYKLSANPGASGEYWITLDLAAGAEFKITNGNKTNWYPGGSNNNYVVSEAGNYTVYFRPAGNSSWANGYFYVAKNEIPTYAVTVTTDGNGTATADVSNAKAGDTVTVTITPNEGYVYDSATGADDWTYDEATGTGTFTMPASDVTISVTFREKPAPQAYAVKTLITGEGTVDVPANATEGDTVTLTATPAEGYTLRALKVNGQDVTSAYLASNSYSFTMPGYAVTIEAVFDEVGEGEHTVYVNVYGLGTAFADKTTAAAGETVTITIEENIGYVFKQLVVNNVEQGEGVLTFTMPNADAIVNVYFVRTVYGITLYSGVQGTMNAIPRNNQAYADTTVQIVVNADEDYAVESLTVKNDTTNETIEATLKEQDGQTSIYTFTMPASSVTVTATYHKRATNGYYLIGTHGWAANPADNINMIDGNDKFVEDLSVSGQMLLTVDLAAGQSFKVVKVVDGVIDTWYPATGDDYQVDSAHAGSCVIYFRPAYGGDSAWYQSCIYVKKLENDFYLVNIKDSGNAIRQDDKLYINKEFNANEIINSKNETIRGLYGSEYEHMVLTWLNTNDKIKVVRVQNGNIVEWLPSEMETEYPTYRYSDSEYAQDPAYTGMVFVFFEEQIGKVTGYDGQIHYPRVDWTNRVFDVQKAYRADAAEKASVNPLNAESLTYNLEHGSITLSTGTAFIREGRSDASGIPTDTSNIIYELGLNQKVYVSILAEAGYALDGTPYITYNGNTVQMTKEGSRWYFTMPSADVVIHAPMRKVFRTQSVLLSGQIGVNFYVDLAGLDKSKCEMRFKIGKSTEVQTDTFDPNCHSTITPSNYGFTCFLNAIQMADDITAELWCDGERISYKHYSLEEYVMYFERADSTQDGVVDALRVIRAMIDFGYYAQKYFFKLKPSIADDYTAVVRYYATQYDFPTIQRMTESHSREYPGNLDLDNSDIERVGLVLTLESATALTAKLYMKADTTSTPEIRINGETLSLENPLIERDGWKWTMEDASSGSTRCYAVTIAGISPHNLDKQFILSGTAGGRFRITVSAFSYIDAVLNADSMENRDEARMMAAAMYQFHEAEVAYRTSIGMSN